jgi:5-methylcytosine-specific restriction endonuclease McrA
MSRRYRDPQFLREQYIQKRKSVPEIAELCSVSSSTISRWLDRHGIDRDLKYQDETWLRTQYLKRGRQQDEIAAECNVSKTTICYWLGRLGITEGSSLRTAECASCGGTFRYYPSVRDGQFCSARCEREQWKRQETVTCPECGDTFERRASLDTEYCSMACWGRDFREDTNRFYSASWQSRRRDALQRDGFECTLCGLSDSAHRAVTDRQLDVHHVVPVRVFAKQDRPPEEAHALDNLLTVCQMCHPDRFGWI